MTRQRGLRRQSGGLRQLERRLRVAIVDDVVVIVVVRGERQSIRFVLR